MSSPHRPAFVKQLDGSPLGGLSCTAAAAAMALDRETIGVKTTTGARVRDLTGDTKGGTTLAQVTAVLSRDFGVSLSTRTPGSLADFDNRLRDGQGAILQGASSATRGTQWQASETFGGNHAWYVNAGRGWSLVAGLWKPDEYLVYDPLADGRRAGIAVSPFWLPRFHLMTFALRLDLDGRGNLLGMGKVYAAYTRDTEPHHHAKYGGKATTPYPDRTRGKAAAGRRVNIRATPSTNAPIVDWLDDGELFIAYQRTTTGGLLAGSKVWMGDHDGNRWVHVSGLSHTGGST